MKFAEDAGGHQTIILCQHMATSTFEKYRVSEETFFKMYLFKFPSLRKREKAQAREGQREKEERARILSTLPTKSAEPDVGPIPRTVRSWPKSKLDTQLTKPPRCPISGGVLYGFLNECPRELSASSLSSMSKADIDVRVLGVGMSLRTPHYTL